MQFVGSRHRAQILQRELRQAMSVIHGDPAARDELRFRVERRLGGLIGVEYTRFFVDRFLHPRAFLTGTEHRGPTWLGVPTWKIPLDAWVVQEIIVDTHPDLIVETGTAFGGSAMFYASLFDALGGGEVVTIDADQSMVYPSVRDHSRVRLIEGRSTATEIVDQVRALAADRRVMVILDSDHGFENVSKELDQFAPLVTPGCYLIVEDTAMGREYFPNSGDPAGALAAWLLDHPGFEPDLARDRFSVTQTPGGYVRRMY